MDPAADAPSEEDKARLAKKMHSLFFPSVWREAVVSPTNLMLLAGKIRNAEESALYSKALTH